MSEDKDSKTTDQNQAVNANNEASEDSVDQERGSALPTKMAADSETVNSADSNKSEAKAKPRHQRKSGSKKPFPWISTTILLVIVVLAAGNYWQFQQGQILKQSQAQFGQQLSDATQSIVSLDSQLNETSDQQKSLAQKAQLNEQNQQALQATMEQMSQQLKELAIEKGKEPLFWRVSEVEYLLSVANHRLILEKDVATAKTALEDADKRLKVIGDPGLIPIRNQVANEISMLKQVEIPDIAGMASQLGSVAAAIEQLPFVKSTPGMSNSEISKSADEATDTIGFVRQLVKDITSGLFTIQRTDEPIEPLLPPQEKQFLKHNLNLKIEEARIALLNQETELFQKNLEAVVQWTQKYFDVQDPSVANFLQTLTELKKVNLQPALPDISNSLRELRAWMSQHKQVALEQPAPVSDKLASSQVVQIQEVMHQ